MAGIAFTILGESKVVVLMDRSEYQIVKKIEEKGWSNIDPKVISDSLVQVKSNPLPFPSRLEKPKK